MTLLNFNFIPDDPISDFRIPTVKGSGPERLTAFRFSFNFSFNFSFSLRGPWEAQNLPFLFVFLLSTKNHQKEGAQSSDLSGN